MAQVQLVMKGGVGTGPNIPGSGVGVYTALIDGKYAIHAYLGGAYNAGLTNEDPPITIPDADHHTVEFSASGGIGIGFRQFADPAVSLYYTGTSISLQLNGVDVLDFVHNSSIIFAPGTNSVSIGSTDEIIISKAPPIQGLSCWFNSSGIIPLTTVIDPQPNAGIGCWLGYATYTPIQGTIGTDVQTYDRAGNFLKYIPEAWGPGLADLESKYLSIGALPNTYERPSILDHDIYDLSTNEEHIGYKIFPSCQPDEDIFDLVAGNGQVMTGIKLSLDDFKTLQDEITNNPLYGGATIKNSSQTWEDPSSFQSLNAINDFLAKNAGAPQYLLVTVIAGNNQESSFIMSKADLASLDNTIHSGDPRYTNAGITSSSPVYPKPSVPLTQVVDFLNTNAFPSNNTVFAALSISGVLVNGIVLADNDFQQLQTLIASNARLGQTNIYGVAPSYDKVNSDLQTVLSFLEGTISNPKTSSNGIISAIPLSKNGIIAVAAVGTVAAATTIAYLATRKG